MVVSKKFSRLSWPAIVSGLALYLIIARQEGGAACWSTSFLQGGSRSLNLHSAATARQHGQLAGPLCPSCNASAVPGQYAVMPDFSIVPVPSAFEARSNRATHASTARYLLHNIVLREVVDKVWLSDKTATALYTTYFTQPDALLSYNFRGLRLDVPTAYMYTRTGPGGKLTDVATRKRYFQRHIDSINEFGPLVKDKGYIDGAQHRDRQLLWIIVEDAAKLDPKLAAFLQESKLREYSSLMVCSDLLTSVPHCSAFLYFACGPTRWLGVAQWNAVERAVEILRDTFFACVFRGHP